MECFFCHREITGKFHRPRGKLLKSLKSLCPAVTTESIMCQSCYKKAYQQLQRYLIKIAKQKDDASESGSVTVTTSGSRQNRSSSMSQDEFDMIVNRRPDWRLQQAKRAAQADRHRPSGIVALTRDEMISRSQTSNTSVNESESLVEPIQAVVESSNESIGNVVNLDETPTISALSSDGLASRVIERIYESDDDSFETGPADRLPGVGPIIKKRRTKIIFDREYEELVHNSKNYGG